MKMNKIVWCCLLAALLCSCSREYIFAEKDRLTPQEEEAVIVYVRKFLRHDKKIKLTPEERSIIQDQKPDFAIQYRGYKEGLLSIRWKLPNYRVLLLQRTGKLLAEERADWVIRIISDTASGKLPKDSFGSQGEDLSLPPL